LLGTPCHQIFKNRQTAKHLFLIAHEKTGKEGDKWITKTLESCSVVASFVANSAFKATTAISCTQTPSNRTYVPILEPSLIVCMEPTIPILFPGRGNKDSLSTTLLNFS